MREQRDKRITGTLQSTERLPDVPRRHGRHSVSAVSSQPRHQTEHDFPGYIYAYDGRTGGFKPHRTIPVPVPYRVIVILISAVGFSVGIGIFIAECIRS